MAHLLPYIQVVLALLLIVSVLFQRSEAGLGSAFGGGDGMSSTHTTRRGFEKTSFIATIVIAVLFAAAVFASLLIGR